MDAFNDPVLAAWRAYGDWGFKIVILGVIGEVVSAGIDSIAEKRCKDWHKKWKRSLRITELVSGAVLIFGLAMEYRGHKKETQILDSYNAQSYVHAADAERDAENAREQVAALTNETLSLSVELEKLRHENLVLQDQLISVSNSAAMNSPSNFPISSVEGNGYIVVRKQDAAIISDLKDKSAVIWLISSNELFMGGMPGGMVSVFGSIDSVDTNTNGPEDPEVDFSFRQTNLRAVGATQPVTFNNVGLVRLNILEGSGVKYPNGRFVVEKGFLDLELNSEFEFRVEFVFPSQTNGEIGVWGLRHNEWP